MKFCVQFDPIFPLSLNQHRRQQMRLRANLQRTALSAPLVLLSGVAFGNTFYCNGTVGDKPPLKVTATAAEGLIVEMPGRGPTNFGPVDMNGTTYDARRYESENGTTASSHFVVDRRTGAFTFDMHVQVPGMSPLDPHVDGHCEGVDPPAGFTPSDPATGGSPTQSSADSTGPAKSESELGAPNLSDEAARADADDSQQAEAEARRLEEEARVAREKADKAKRDRDLKEARERADAERLKLEAEEDRKRKEAADLAAREKAKAEAKDRADQQRRHDERSLTGSFVGQATTCPGGGVGILYLRSSHPPKLGCDVQFQAVCPGGVGAAVNFSQTNYIGSNCLGIGDATRIGQMPCAPEQVQIEMTRASCPE